MKRCPECRRDYIDETLKYCLDDGSVLLDGPGSDEARTAMLPAGAGSHEVTLKLPAQNPESRPAKKLVWAGAAAAMVLIAGISVYWAWFRNTSPRASESYRTVDSPAYDYYLRGKLDATSQNRERNLNAIRILEEVVAADRGFAPAYASLARAYAIRADLFARREEQKKLYDDAKLFAEKALAIDPLLAEAHLARGAAIWNHVDRFPHEQSIQAYKKAIALDPENEEAHHLLGLVYYHIGLLDEAEAELRRANELDPSNSMTRFRLGQVAALRTDYEGALTAFKAVPREANVMVIDRAMAGVLFQLGRTDEAWKIVDNFIATNSDEGGNVTSVKAMLLAKAGRATEAEEAIRETIEKGRGFQHFHHAAYNIASAYAMLHDRDEAIKWLQITVDEGFPCYPLFLRDTNLDVLRPDERFTAMMAELKLNWERRNAMLRL